MTSFLALLGVSAYAADRGPLVALSAVTVLVYCLTATVLGQALAWFFEGVRQRRAGRVAVRVCAAVLIAVALVVQLTGNLTDVLDRLPTTRIALSANFGAQGRYLSWVTPLLFLLAVAASALWLGERACGWTQRQVSDGGLQPETRPVRRRTGATSDLRALMQVDRASVWRSAPLRRGAIVMAVLPGAIAAITEPRWDSLVLLTGLVAAGSGLLFGVNAFGMDGPGALTLEGLPMAPSLRYWAKALVIIEFAALTIAGALLVGAFRADGAPTLTQLTALLCSLVVSALAVASFCMRVSVRSPHRAELRGRRDTPAPPGAMIAYSTRLAWRTTWIAMVLSIVALAPWPWLPVAVAVPMGCLAGMSLIRSADEWQDETVRSRIVSTVASG
jgi:hypothetical protein